MGTLEQLRAEQQARNEEAARKFVAEAAPAVIEWARTDPYVQDVLSKGGEFSCISAPRGWMIVAAERDSMTFVAYAAVWQRETIDGMLDALDGAGVGT